MWVDFQFEGPFGRGTSEPQAHGFSQEIQKGLVMILSDDPGPSESGSDVSVVSA